MGCGHWLAESPRGITLQIYLALIGALLLQLDLGRRASRRVWELLQWHQMGMMDDAEPAAQLTAQLDGEEQALAKKTKAPANWAPLLSPRSARAQPAQKGHPQARNPAPPRTNASTRHRRLQTQLLNTRHAGHLWLPACRSSRLGSQCSVRTAPNQLNRSG